MKRREMLGLVLLVLGILYSGFLHLAQRDMDSPKLLADPISKDEVVRQFPFLNLAASVFHFDLYTPSEVDDHPIPKSYYFRLRIKRHLWYGIAWAMLGGAMIVFRKPSRYTQLAYYCCIVGFGCALCMAAALHPMVQLWKGK